MDEHFSLKFRAEVFEEDGVYVAICPELDVSSFGPTVEGAERALQEAVEAFVEGCQELGTLSEVLEEAGFHREGEAWIAREPAAMSTLVAKA